MALSRVVGVLSCRVFDLTRVSRCERMRKVAIWMLALLRHPPTNQKKTTMTHDAAELLSIEHFEDQ